MLLRIGYQLCGRVKTHWLTVEQCRAKCSRVVAFKVAGRIHEQREACRMRLGKTVFAKPSNLIENMFCKGLAKSGRVSPKPLKCCIEST